MIYDVAVVGAGPAGMAAAIEAAKAGASVLLVEKQWRVGRRLAVTGGGRGNLGNLNLDSSFYNADARRLVEQVPLVLEKDALSAYFKSLGILLTKDEEGRLYPYTRQAQTVVRTLEDLLSSLDVQVELNVTLESFEMNKDALAGGSYKLKTSLGERFSKALVLAVGGMARPALGGGDDAFRLLADKGYNLTPAFPALVSLLTEKTLAKADGVRVMARGKLKDKRGTIIKESSGEYQITKTGLTGIAAMQLGRFVEARRAASLSLDFAPDLSELEVETWLHEVRKSQPDRDLLFLLTSLLPQKLALVLGKKIAKQNPQDLAPFIKAVKATELIVLGTTGWQQAQVMAGGIACSEVDPLSLESRLQRGLFLCGEMLDVDGDTGGYNLNWAFLSGLRAGRSASFYAQSTNKAR